MKKGKQLSFAGIDGAGKTTQAKNLSHELQKKGFHVVINHQFETEVGHTCRKILSHTIDPYLRAFLFALDHYAARDKIFSMLERYDLVISDRSFYCSIAYLIPRGLSKNWIVSLYQYLPRPDLVILLDIPVKVALKRKPFDDLVPVKTINFLDQVRECYLSLAEKESFIKIDGNLSEKEITQKILKILIQKEVIKI
ncbi:MAG: dTMP kinase [Candidatus Methanofastidiosia archaeon]|jgi:dTMP kinase